MTVLENVRDQLAAMLSVRGDDIAKMDAERAIVAAEVETTKALLADVEAEIAKPAPVVEDPKPLTLAEIRKAFDAYVDSLPAA